MKKIYLLLFSFLFFANSNFSQSPGEEIFDTSYVHEIRITFANPDFWQVMTDNYFNNQVNGVPTDVPYLESTISIDGNVLDSVGVRQKGFSSHFASNQFKKSLKLDFNEFISGQSYDGMKKLNLNNGVGDPALQRDLLAYDMMRKAGIRAPRTSYAKVFLNDTYWGLYLILEQVDKTFVKNNFANGQGDLYKNIGWSSLTWNGSSPSNYEESIALRTNKTTSDFSDFIEFVDILNNASDTDFADSIVTVFNVDYYLRVLAIDIMTNNWDSYIEHGRNFYMYHEPNSDQFFWIPWDYNLSMGGDFFGGGGGSGGGGLPDDPADCETIQSGSCPYEATDTAFIATINADPFCCNQNWDGICQGIYDDFIANGTGGGNGLPDDPADCQSILNGSCPHEPDDSVFLQVINNQPDCCLDTWGGSCQAEYDAIVAGMGPNFNDFPLILENPDKVLINRIMNVPEFRERYLNYCCQILEENFTFERLEPIIDYHGAKIAEGVAEDNNYVFSVEQFNYDISDGDLSSNIPSLKEYFNHRIPTLEQDLISLNHVCADLVSSIGWHDVVINEFVASNDSLSGIVDQNGQYDDWIEIYNNTNTVIDLTDFYLTDSIAGKKRWRFPAGTHIGVDEYLIVWADEDVTQDGLHANFKLSSQGEQLMLAHFDGTVIDSLTFGPQTTNQPSARIPNGTGDFKEVLPTFASINLDVVSTEELQLLDFKVYPNPAKDRITLSFDRNVFQGKMDIRITNLLGQTIYNNTNTNDWKIEIPVNNWNAGVYLIEVRGDDYRGIKKLVVK